MPHIISKTTTMLNTGEFIGEAVGIAGCLLYLNAMTSQANAFKIYRNISIGVIATFALISLLLILASFISDDNDNNKAFAVAKSNATMILFQAFGLLSLLTVGGYIYFLYHNPTDGFHVRTNIENSFYLKMIILGIALYGLFSALLSFYRYSVALKNTKLQPSIPMKVLFYLSLILLFFVSLAVLGLSYYHMISNYVFFGAITFVCIGMGLLNLIGIGLLFTRIGRIIVNPLNAQEAVESSRKDNSISSETKLENNSEKCYNAGKFNENSINRRSFSQKSDQSSSQLIAAEKNKRTREKLIFVRLRSQLIRSVLMTFTSFSLLGTGTGLMMMNSNTCHIISIGLLFSGFILQLSSTAVGEKNYYYDSKKNCLFYEKLPCINEFIEYLATPASAKVK